MPNYWLVGAMYSGRYDQTPKIVRRGYWKLGWSDADKPQMAKLRDQIARGDRIAITSERSMAHFWKKMGG